jgi:hypothetical protein
VKRSRNQPIIAPGHSFKSVTEKISAIVLGKGFRPGWLFGLAISFSLLMLFNLMIGLLLTKGVGIWGINIPIGWGFAIVNFVWWIGIGHAGTLISAILLLLHQQWRTSINRFRRSDDAVRGGLRGHVSAAAHGPAVAVLLADAVSESDVAVAAVPQPAGLGRFRGIYVRDCLLTLLVCWTCAGPGDTARQGDEQGFQGHLWGVFAGLEKSAVHWSRYETASLLLAGLATPLVVSVHTVVSFDFSVGQLAGWHTTIFPPYFVAGAIYSGFAMVLTLAIPIRKFYHLEDFITLRHLNTMAKVMLATGLDRGLRLRD